MLYQQPKERTRPIWKGSIRFGLVNIPVGLFPATATKALDFHMLDDRDHARIHLKRISETTGEEVALEHIVKGFELGNGEWVVLSDEEIQNASPEKSRAIDILEFVDEAQVPSLYFERPYYAVPDKSAVKAYAVLREALARTTKAGIGQFVLRNRVHLCALKAQGGVLVLNALRFANEVLSTADLPIPHLPNPGEKEVAMAVRLIEEMSGDFKPEKYKDTFTEDLKRLIERKASGKTVRRVPKAVPSTKVVDLMSILRASVNKQASAKKKPKQRAAV